jgi:AmmeMemoRadiSam system protein A
MKNIHQKDSSIFKKELLAIARQAVESSVSRQPLPRAGFTSQRLKQQLGAFVTLKKNNRLRGCIGLIESKEPLFLTVQKMAKAAALEDPRFDAVTEDELEKIKIEVSVLTQPRIIKNPDKIVVGQHGVIIELFGRKGVFLPQVASEHNYNRRQFLQALCRHKLGLDFSCWKNKQAKIYVFETEIYSD